MRHMDEGLLQAWLDGSGSGLSKEERTRVEAHLEECFECRARVDDLRSSTDDAVDLLALTAGPEDEEIPDFDQVVARARKMDGRRRRLPAWVTLGWAASIAVALGAGWLSNEWLSPRIPDDALPAPSTAPAGVETGAAETERPADAAGSPEQAEEEAGAAAEVTAATPPPPNASQALRETEPSSDGAERLAEVEGPPEGAMARPEADVAAEVLGAEAVQGPMALTGRVVDEVSGRPLRAAQVSIEGARAGALTNQDGRYLILMPAAVDTLEEVTLEVNLVGYGPERRTLALSGVDSTIADFQLSAQAMALQELAVTGTADEPDAPRRRATADAVNAERQDEAAVSWRAVSPGEAEAIAGFSVRSVAGLEVVSVEAGTYLASPVIRVVQLLETGELLTLLQTHEDDPVPGPDAGLFGAAEVQASSVEEAVVRLEGGVTVTARAPLPADALQALLGGLR